MSCVTLHPSYDPAVYGTNDVAVITLRDPADITSSESKARLACLSTSNRLYDGVSLTVSGWGVNSESFTEMTQPGKYTYLLTFKF